MDVFTTDCGLCAILTMFAHGLEGCVLLRFPPHRYQLLPRPRHSGSGILATVSAGDRMSVNSDAIDIQLSEITDPFYRIIKNHFS